MTLPNDNLIAISRECAIKSGNGCCADKPVNLSHSNNGLLTHLADAKTFLTTDKILAAGIYPTCNTTTIVTGFYTRQNYNPNSFSIEQKNTCNT